MTRITDGDRIIALAERLYKGEDVASAVWAVTGGTLTPGPDPERKPATITVSCDLKPREAEFLRAIGAGPEMLSDFLRQRIAEARRAGMAILREQDMTKAPGDGRGVVSMPRSRMGELL